MCKCSISSIPSRAGGKPDNGEPAHKKFKLLTIFDFLDQPELKPLVEDVLPAPGEVHLLFGESNAYKSFLALDLLCSVAHNIPWHGRTVDPGPVIYVVTEGVGAAARQRLRAWLEQHEIPREQWGIVRIIDVPVPLNVVAIVDQLICTIHEDLPSAKLVVFDLLAGSMEGSDGDGDIAGQWVKGTQRLSQATSITQLHVTHSSWGDTKRSRGHTHLWGSFSTRLKAEGNTLAQTAVLTVQRHKDEDSANLEWSFRLDKVLVGDGPKTSLIPIMLETKAAKKAGGRKRNEKRDQLSKLFLQALDHEADGCTSSPGFNGAPVLKVPRDKVRDYMKRRGWLDLDEQGQISTKGRSEFSRIRVDLEGTVTEQDGLIWRV